MYQFENELSREQIVKIVAYRATIVICLMLADAQTRCCRFFVSIFCFVKNKYLARSIHQIYSHIDFVQSGDCWLINPLIEKLNLTKKNGTRLEQYSVVFLSLIRNSVINLIAFNELFNCIPTPVNY